MKSVKIDNKYGTHALSVVTDDEGGNVAISSYHGPMNFLAFLTPAQARQMAIALANAADQIEMHNKKEVEDECA